MIMLFFMRRASWRTLLLLLPLASGIGLWFPAGANRQATFEQENLSKLPATEFSRLIREFSEKGGYFHSDNFTSNETSYLHVVGKLREMGIAGGAYIGVGPEQNFTYIAKIRPRIAFVVDIRRQAMLQHLLYKALFHMSESRKEFLSRLISRPIGPEGNTGKSASLEQLLESLTAASPSREMMTTNLAKIREMLRGEFQLPLSLEDQEQLEYVFSTFYRDGIRIGYRAAGIYWGGYSRFPNLRDLILQPDLNGIPGNFLASDEDYRFVRSLHMRNRIIPLVGDFAGPRAIASVGNYLQENGYTVRAFYTSNVEQFLFQNGVFESFVDNIRRLPIDANSVFIRAVTRGHPAYVPGHRTTTLLQRISVFLQDYDEEAYPDYRSLILTHFIAGQ